MVDMTTAIDKMSGKIRYGMPTYFFLCQSHMVQMRRRVSASARCRCVVSALTWPSPFRFLTPRNRASGERHLCRNIFLYGGDNGYMMSATEHHGYLSSLPLLSEITGVRTVTATQMGARWE